MPEHEQYSLAITVRSEDIDLMGHVNNVVYLRWIQELAVAHWHSAASPEAQKQYLWVVTRHEIDYKRPALPGDEIIGRTWVGTATRFAFRRHTSFERAADGKLLAKALTVWCPVDPRTGRPADVSADVRSRFSQPGEIQT